MYVSFSQEELRTICKNCLESFEIWARRLIHHKLVPLYGNNYFEATIRNNENILNREHYQKYMNIYDRQNNRCVRPVDALFIDTLIYILCKQELYKEIFKDALDYAYPQGAEETREFLKRLIEPRNNLSHSNPISIRQVEQVVCYTNDFIDGVKQHFKKIGEERMWNTPLITKATDSLGNEYYPTDDKTLNEYFWIKQQVFHVGDFFKVYIEIDSSFSEEEFRIRWSYNNNGQSTSIINNSKEFCIRFEEKHISKNAFLRCDIIQNKSWHKHRDYDHEISFYFEVLP